MTNIIKNRDFVIFDVETTGLSAATGDRIVEIAALRVRDLKPVEEFHSLINPEMVISYGASMVNGITQEMVQDAPKAKDVIPDFMKFLSDAYPVGHNVKFDLSFLAQELALLGSKLPKDRVAIDTIKMARVLIPGLETYRLWFVAQSLGIDTLQEHRAMSDVLLTFEVFRKLSENAGRKDLLDEDVFINLFSHTKVKAKQLDPQKVTLISEAIESQGKLTMLYFSAVSLSTTSRTVSPKRLVGTGGNMTLIGYCHLRNEERNFRVNRILQMEKCDS